VRRLKRRRGCSTLAGPSGLLHFELHLLVFGQAAEAAGALDFAEVGEEILATTIRGDEAEALAVVEPFHGAGLRGHVVFLSRLLRSTC
jgi:hypothetical protein